MADKRPPPNDWFRLMVESVHDYAIFRLDSQGRIQSWNPGAQQIKQYKAAEVMGQHFSMFYLDSDVRAGKPQRELDAATAEGRFEDEGWRVRKDGSHFWANVVISAMHDAKGTLQGFVKVTRDLTERKEAEEALRQSEQWLYTTLRCIGDAVIATDAVGHVKFLNPVAETLTGWRQDQARTTHLDKVFVIVNAKTRQPVTSPFYKVISTGGVVGLANDTVLIARDGSNA